MRSTLENHLRNSARAEAAPDPFKQPEAFRGILSARLLAFLCDVAVLTTLFLVTSLLLGILGFFTFGLAWLGFKVLMPVLFFSYFVFTLGGTRSATPGMVWQNIEARVWNNHRPGHIQAFVHTLLFYVTGSLFNVLVLIVPFFNTRHRCLHDWLSGIVFRKVTDRIPSS